jgi:hypothetical protein
MQKHLLGYRDNLRVGSAGKIYGLRQDILSKT